MRGSPREAGGTYGVGNYELWLHGWYDKGTSLGFTVCRAVALFCSPHPRLIRVHHSGSPPEEKLRISRSTPSTPRQHFTTNDINPNNNTRARRRCLSHKTTSHASDRPARAANKHPNTYTNHNQHIPAAEPTRHQRHPKHPRPLPTKPLLHPQPRPRPRPTYRTRRQVRQPIPHILRPCAPKHH